MPLSGTHFSCVNFIFPLLLLDFEPHETFLSWVIEVSVSGLNVMSFSLGLSSHGDTANGFGGLRQSVRQALLRLTLTFQHRVPVTPKPLFSPTIGCMSSL